MRTMIYRPSVLLLSLALLAAFAFALLFVPNNRTEPNSTPGTENNSSSSSTKSLVGSSSFLSLTLPSCNASTTFNTIIHTGKDAATLSSLASSYPNDSYLSWLSALPSSAYSKSLYIPTLKDNCKGIAFHWTIDRDQNTIQIAVAAQIKEDQQGQGIERTGGYVAIGFSENGGMRGSDVVYFTSTPSSLPSEDGSESLTTNTNVLVDGHILDFLGKPIPDRRQDWSLISQSVTSDGYIIFEAKRSLTAQNDPFDRPLIDDSSAYVPDHKIIGAWGTSRGNMMYHGHNRVKTSIQLFHSSSNSTGGNLGYYYDNFLSQMDLRSDGNVALNVTSLAIPVKKTHYHNQCISNEDLVNLGFFSTEDGGGSTYVVGYEFPIQPETRKYIHHIVLHAYTNNACENSHSTIFIWSPGEDFFYFPDGAGMKFGGGLNDTDAFRSFNIQYHINNQDLDTGKVDTGSGVRLYYSKTAVENEIGLVEVGDPKLRLSGQEVGLGQTRHVLHCPSSCTKKNMVNDTIKVVRQQLHMHSQGKRIVTQVLRDGSIVHEKFIDYWDYDQNGATAPLSQPFEVKRGDEFRTICYYDVNSNVRFGRASVDEMCIAYIFYFPKQPLRTCGVSYDKDPMCNATYEGRENISNDENFDRVFGSPSKEMSAKPSILPSMEPSPLPTSLPSSLPSSSPSSEPSKTPSLEPSKLPSLVPTSVPTISQKPNQAPSSPPSSEPTVYPSKEPSHSPSVIPSGMPSSSPSQAPSFRLQVFQFSITMDFDTLDEFEGHAKDIFENHVREAIKIILDDTNSEDFAIVASIVGFEVLDNTNDLPRRSLLEKKGLRIFINISATVRSATTYSTSSLIESIELAFGEYNQRYTFVFTLQIKDPNTFESINFIDKILINNKEVHMIAEGGPSALIYIGIGAGGGILVFSIFSYFFCRRWYDTGSSITNTEIERMNSPVDPRLHKTIEFAGDYGDVSTLGDTYVHPGSVVHPRLLQNNTIDTGGDDPNDVNDFDFDYRKIYSGSKLVSSPSQMTASSSRSSQGEKILVCAPPGHLGVVIGTPSGELAVHGIEEESVLYNKIRIGDRLISVDGQSTTGVRADSVSKLIGSKAMNPRRDLVFLRPSSPGSQSSKRSDI